MLIPKLCAVLGVVGLILLPVSAFVGATSMADWTLDAAQAFIILGALIFEAYVILGIVRDAFRSARAVEPA